MILFLVLVFWIFVTHSYIHKVKCGYVLSKITIYTHLNTYFCVQTTHSKFERLKLFLHVSLTVAVCDIFYQMLQTSKTSLCKHDLNT